MLVSKIKYNYGKSEEAVLDDLYEKSFFYLGNTSRVSKVVIKQVLVDKVVLGIEEKSDNLRSMIDHGHFEPAPNKIELKIGEKTQLAISSLVSTTPIEISLLDIHEGKNFQI